MISKIATLFFSIALIFGSYSTVQAQDYIGSAKCGMCHKSATKGNQLGKWKEGPHAKALKSLSSPESLAYAKENGIADPTKDAKCLKCHSTYHSASEDLMLTIKDTEGVSCESCHGPGSKYKSAAVMKSQAKSLANGLILPTKEVCVTCHNEDNPFHKPFDFDAYVKKIAHPNPASK